ncbi:MAG: glycerol kinase GlpK [Burkholderiaceae bacterium]
MPLLLALDQGTSSSRSIVFDENGRIVAMAQREFRQIYPSPGWVEHDPRELWDSQRATVQEVLAADGVDVAAIASVGITNQRETTLLWNRHTGEPLCNAIVWQDRRAEPTCEALRRDGLSPLFQQRTGLVIDAYFSGTKIKWMLDHVPDARRLAERGELAFGTVDSWLIWRMSAGRLHVTDVSNASRTLIYDIRNGCWDPELMRLLDIPEALRLPSVHPSSHAYGHTDPAAFGHALPIGGIAGDQQAALFGQACFEAGMAKNTYGTGCFMLMHTGDRCQTSSNGLVSTAAAQIDDRRHYALEGSVFIGGAVVQWLRDGLGAIQKSSDIEALAESVPDSGGVVMVPAFTGLGAPYWRPKAKGAVFGLTRGTGIGHIARAALESIAFQSAALLDAMRRDAVTPVTELRVDGGACSNNLLMQFQADLLGVPVVRPRVTETTALGAAYLAGLQCGVFASLEQIASHWHVDRTFIPTMSRDEAQARMAAWEQAVRRTGDEP